MTEDEPKNRGDVPSPVDVTERFLQMSLAEFRDFLDEYWRKYNNAKVSINVLEVQLTELQKRFLANLERDPRVAINIQK